MSSSVEITRKSGSNLALSFVSLPKEKQRAMSIFYAYCRLIDDIADSTDLSLSEKSTQLNYWRMEIHRAYEGTPESELGREMAEIAKTYNIPRCHVIEVLDGVEMDLNKTRYENFNELERYCYHVASAVGLVSICIFGCRDEKAKEYAVALGMAFQLTNILRDVSKDAEFDRIYLPKDEMAAFGVQEKDVLLRRYTPEFQRLMQFHDQRATHYFEKARRLMPESDRPCLVAAEVMTTVYWGILKKARAVQYNVMDHSARLNKLEKLWAIVRTMRYPKPFPKSRVKKIAVLGGGFAGVAAALELARMGHSVTLIERSTTLGGRASSFRESGTGDILDNGQHVLMGCYVETLRLLGQLGVQDRLLIPNRMRVPYRSPRGASILETWPLPSPFDLLSGLFRFKELTWSGKIAACRLGLALRSGRYPEPATNAMEWLKKEGQTEDVVRAVWEPFCLAALNEPLATASARLLSEVISRALLSGSGNSKIILSRVGLSELLEPGVEQLLVMMEGRVRRRTAVTGLDIHGNRCIGLTLSGGERLSVDEVVSALPWHALRPLIPPGNDLAMALERLYPAPLINLHLWVDRPIIGSPFCGLIESPVQWIFETCHYHGPDKSGETHLAVVISAGYEWSQLSTEEVVDRTVGEIKKFFPEAAEMSVIRHRMYRALTATLASKPMVERYRPGIRTPWENVWLAGDWTSTGLPGTIEGATWSGIHAARSVDGEDSGFMR